MVESAILRLVSVAVLSTGLDQNANYHVKRVALELAVRPSAAVLMVVNVMAPEIVSVDQVTSVINVANHAMLVFGEISAAKGVSAKMPKGLVIMNQGSANVYQDGEATSAIFHANLVIMACSVN